MCFLATTDWTEEDCKEECCKGGPLVKERGTGKYQSTQARLFTCKVKFDNSLALGIKYILYTIVGKCHECCFRPELPECEYVRVSCDGCMRPGNIVNLVFNISTLWLIYALVIRRMLYYNRHCKKSKFFQMKLVLENIVVRRADFQVTSVVVRDNASFLVYL